MWSWGAEMPEPALPLKEYRRFESFREYETLFDTLLTQTQTFIRVFDKSLPRAWNTSERNEVLRQFLRRDPANRLMIVVHDADNIDRELPRFADMLRDFSHAAKVRLTPKMAKHIYDPFIVFDASHYLHRFHHAHMRAAQGTHDVDGAIELLDRHAELWEVSSPISSSGV